MGSKKVFMTAKRRGAGWKREERIRGKRRPTPPTRRDLKAAAGIVRNTDRVMDLAHNGIKSRYRAPHTRCRQKRPMDSKAFRPPLPGMQHRCHPVTLKRVMWGDTTEWNFSYIHVQRKVHHHHVLAVDTLTSETKGTQKTTQSFSFSASAQTNPRLCAMKLYLSADSSILFFVDFPAPCPLFLSTRSKSGFGLSALTCCS